MTDDYKTRDQLLQELSSLRRRVAQLETTAIDRNQVVGALQESERRYHSLVEDSLGLICIHDLQGELLYVNPAALQALRYPPHRQIHGNLRDILAPAVRPLFETYLEQIRTESTARGLMQVMTQDGEIRVWQYQNVRYEEQERPPYVIGYAQDVTDHIHMKKGLQQAKEEAEAADRAKSEFLAAMSHELRTPLSVIIGYSDIMLEGEAGPLLSQQLGMVRQIRKRARELHDLISAVLDLSRLEAGRLPMYEREVEVKALMGEVQAEMAGVHKSPQVALEWVIHPQLPPLYTDAGKLKVIIKNLVSNALKFTAQGRIAVTTCRRADGVEIRVTDTGPGIPRESIAEVFEAFRQVSNPSVNRQSGTGLGLHIVKRFIDLLGGTIDVESEVGRGSTFRVWFPAGKRTAELPIWTGAKPEEPRQ